MQHVQLWPRPPNCRPPTPRPDGTAWPAVVLPPQEVYVASERAKREAWMAEQTRSIKAATIKGVEPEIQVWVRVRECRQVDS